MEGVVAYLTGRRKRKFRKRARQAEDAGLAKRYLIVLNVAEGRPPGDTARALGVSPNTVRRVCRRFEEHGEAGLVDRREDNGSRKIDDDFLEALREVVAAQPTDYGWRRPTWTQELLVKAMAAKTGTEVSLATISRALRAIRARWGMPKPTVGCPWSKARKERRLREIRRLLALLPPNEMAFYEDEVDIHLNPKIGRDWMLCGQQKEVLTPGKNEKRYLAGAQNVRNGELIWVEGDRKNSLLFVRLLWELVQRHPDAKVIHVILDNYSIHSTQQVELSLRTPAGQRIKLHFLPPYCPDHNKIERTWEDLHANVTRNHRCADMTELMREVHHYLRDRNRDLPTHCRLAA